MISKEIFTQGMMLLDTSYHNFKGMTSEETFQIWYKALEDLDEQAFIDAVKVYVSTEEYPPSIASIRKLATTQINFNDWSIGWNLVKESLSRYGYYREIEALDWIAGFDKIASEAIKRLGYKTFCNASVQEESTYRAQFRMAYENIENRAGKMQAIPTTVMASLAEKDEKALESTDDLANQLAEKLSF